MGYWVKQQDHQHSTLPVPDPNCFTMTVATATGCGHCMGMGKYNRGKVPSTINIKPLSIHSFLPCSRLSQACGQCVERRQSTALARDKTMMKYSRRTNEMMQLHSAPLWSSLRSDQPHVVGGGGGRAPGAGRGGAGVRAQAAGLHLPRLQQQVLPPRPALPRLGHRAPGHGPGRGHLYC